LQTFFKSKKTIFLKRDYWIDVDPPQLGLYPR
jgi:hypothetical protein